MAENTVMNLKVFLRNDKEAEARRFSVDMSAVTSFVFIKEKLQTVFPALRRSPFKLTWKDKDGDEITIASDEDLITAFTEMSELPVKVLYIQTATPNQPENNIFVEADLEFPIRSSRVICDVCNTMINSLRYKCLQCPDYDLCASCEFQGNHSEHIMMRLPNSDSNLPRCARKFMHHLGREIKKSAHHANKEAFRAAKCARKFCGQSTSQPKPAEHPPCGSTPQGQSQSGCPFTSQEYNGMNLNDLLGLGGDMAKQHLPTLVDLLQNVVGTPAPNNNNNNNANTKEGEANNTNDNTNANTENTPNMNEQMGLLSDAFRNIIGSFLVPFPKDNPEEQKTDSSEKPTEIKTAEMVAMDVDTNVLDQTEQLPRRDPGWTFVATNPTPVSEPNPQQTATAPTLVYHDNPKIAEGLVKLHEMGFSNDGGFLTQMLERHNGNVAAVVRAILDSAT